MTADAFCTVQLGNTVVIKRNRLMTAVITRNITSSATNALFLVKLQENNRFSVKFIGCNEFRKFRSDKLRNALCADLFHILCKTVRQVVNYAITVLHNRCCDLYVCTAERQEVQSVAPTFNAADTRKRNVFQSGIFRHISDKSQRNRFHGFSRIARHGSFSVNLAVTGKSYAFYRVDSGYSVRAALNCRCRGDFNMGYVFASTGNFVPSFASSV